jgi:3-deoxy-7-phosphoheptulonate synthase
VEINMNRGTPVVPEVISGIQRSAPLQRPEWNDDVQLPWVLANLAARQPLVSAEQVDTLRSLLALVAAGEAHVVQAGDCCEDPRECSAEHVRRKSAVLDLLAGTVMLGTNKPVLRVGRIAGQFAKPRSNPLEQIGDLVLPTFRGHMVNDPMPDAWWRRPDPLRILACYKVAKPVMDQLGWLEPRPSRVKAQVEAPIWTSHEALLLEYELPMVRRRADGRRWLGSTHWPWVGYRTSQLHGAHVTLLAEITNPVACKVGPTMSPAALLELCERLDPDRQAGRLTLIARMGAGRVADRLPGLVEVVHSAGHPVIWLCDPMHGNTLTTPDGYKTRLLEDIHQEVDDFKRAVAVGNGVAGGIHLETTPNDVTECVADASEIDSVGDRYTSLCDPRLTPRQAVSVVSAWARATSREEL